MFASGPVGRVFAAGVVVGMLLPFVVGLAVLAPVRVTGQLVFLVLVAVELTFIVVRSLVGRNV